MKVRWTAEAEDDRRQIRNYIAADNPMAAIRTDDLFTRAAATLVSLADRGRPGLVPDTRELMPLKNYRLVYQVVADTVWILALVHTARRWPP